MAKPGISRGLGSSCGCDARQRVTSASWTAPSGSHRSATASRSVPLALLVEQRGGTGLAVAALFVAHVEPGRAAAPGRPGCWRDRWSPRRLLIVSSLAAAALSAGARVRPDGLAAMLGAGRR